MLPHYWNLKIVKSSVICYLHFLWCQKSILLFNMTTFSLCIPERQKRGGKWGFFSGRLSFTREFCPLQDINQSWKMFLSCGVLEDEPGWGLWKGPYGKEISPLTAVLSRLLEVFKFPFVWRNKYVLFSHFQSSVEIVDKLSKQKLHVPVLSVMYNL